MAHNDAIAACRCVLAIIAGALTRVITVPAPRPAAVQTDTLALAGDAVALARAAGAVRVGRAVARHGRVGAGAVGAVRERRAAAGAGGRCRQVAEIGGDVLCVVVVQARGAEALGQLVDGAVGIVLVQDVLGRVGRHGLGCLDLRNGQRAALGNVDGQG